MDKPQDDRQPVTIKAMPVAAWKRAREAAEKQDQSMAEWLARAINQLADMEAGARVTMPGKPDKPEAPAMPAADLEALMRAAHAVSEASGVPVPKVAARHAFALLTGQMRAARGLPVRQTSRKSGVTRAVIEYDPSTSA